jgi:Na+/melibiose symporter-like transporter
VFSNDPAGHSAQIFNTIWIVVFALIFFSTYTMCLIAFYGSLSTVCDGEKQRLRVSSYKAFFDTISYCIAYALVPVFLQAFNLHIDKFAMIATTLMITMIIPLFMIKEGEKYGYPEREGIIEDHVTILQSLKITFGNKVFMSWLIVNCTSFFGLQMFLVSMNALINGGMGFGNLEMAIIETCAFAPVPIMLYLFNKLKAKKGVRFTYQTCLIAFALAILSFDFASLYVTGGNKAVQYAIACTGGVIGSWGIGAFFMMPYLVPAQVSSVEEKLTKTNHSAMYFAAQAVTTSIIGAIASGLVYENIKMLFISKEANGVVWAENAADAATKLGGVAEASVFNLGTLLVPIIVSIMCLLGFIVAFKMPRDYTPELVAKELKKFHPDLDVSELVSDEADLKAEKDATGVNIGLWVLSGSIFGFIWSAFQLRILSKKNKNALVKNAPITWILSTLIPFFSIFTLVKMYRVIREESEKLGVKSTSIKAHVILGIIFPILPVNVVSLALLQKDLNRIDA